MPKTINNTNAAFILRTDDVIQAGGSVTFKRLGDTEVILAYVTLPSADLKDVALETVDYTTLFAGGTTLEWHTIADELEVNGVPIYR